MNKLNLTMISRRHRKLREKQCKEREQHLQEQLWEAWRARDFSRVHRLRSFLANSGHAPRRRRYWAPTQLVPSKAQWATTVSLPGVLGGMEGEVRDFDVHESIFRKEVQDFDITPFPEGDRNIDQAAKTDWQNMILGITESKEKKGSTKLGSVERELDFGYDPKPQSQI